MALLLVCYEYDVLSLEKVFQQILRLYLPVTLQKNLASSLSLYSQPVFQVSHPRATGTYGCESEQR